MEKDAKRDIVSRLKLYVEQTENNIQKPSRIPSQYDKYEIHNIMDGYESASSGYSCFIMEKRFPLTYIYGGYALGEALTVTKDSLKRICPGISSDTFDIGISSETSNMFIDICSVKPSEITIQDLIFLDTETTGLSGGTGTVVFLAGTGFFTEDSFVVRQYFMRDYDEEIAMLEALSELLASCKGIVTFNGKAFDWNLLQTRYIFNRLKVPLEDFIHIDLLFPARKIWKFKLESCSLSSLEENILGEFRIDDIPGSMIPSIYFKYLMDRDAREIKRVIKHNEQDILSMVSLLLKINELLQSPIENAEDGQELLGLSRIFEACGESDNFIECMEKCVQSDNKRVRDAALKKLTQLYKRKGEYDKAVEHWNRVLEQDGTFNLFAMIELAKYYEHKEKNVAKALEITEKAFQISYKMGINNSIYKDDLKKRLNRLRAKAGKMKNA
ncbi:MAG TPA: hypothetical protein GXX37_11100 [Clostridiaceae bacterium]|nr:hypothetical protein [Clostridiaceae bacterium]